MAPAFHEYWAALAFELRDRGHEVTPWIYDENPTLRRKIRTKGLELASRVAPERTERAVRQAATRSALQVLRTQRFDRILAIKSDLLGPEFWQAAHDDHIPVTLYLYDEIRRMRWSTSSLIEAVGGGHLLTYSPQDRTSLLQHREEVHLWANAFDHRAPVHPVPRDEVVFIGARYPVREATLVALHEAGVPVRAFGRDWSHHWVDRLRTWNATRPELPAERDVDRSAGYGILGGARAAINVHHDQDGFTMRTFEIPGCGGLQIIDREDVASIYEPGVEVLVAGSTDEMVDLCHRAAHDRSWAQAIREAGRRRTLTEHTYVQRVDELEAWWA